MTMEGTGIVPVMDMNNRNYGDGYGYGGMWFMWIIVLFALMWGGNGWGNRGNGFDNMAAAFANGTATRNEITNGFNLMGKKSPTSIGGAMNCPIIFQKTK